MIPRSKIALMIAISFALSACSPSDGENAEPVRPVLTEAVAEAASRAAPLTGYIAARIEARLGFRVLGRLTSRPVSVGDSVRKGDVIATIDATALELAVRSARWELSNTQAQLRNATSTRQRQARLVETGSASRAALEEAEQGLRSAVASVARAEANLNKAEEQLGYAQLEAEFDGVITATSAEVGQTLSLGQAVVTIARPDQRDAVVDVPDDAAASLELNTSFNVSLQLDPAHVINGTVREIGPQADAATRTRRVRIALVNPSNAFRLGAVVTASVASEATPHLVVPATSIRRKDGSTEVFVVDQQASVVRLRSVRLAAGGPKGSYVQIAEGLEKGERVVIAGVNVLEDGQTIRLDQGN